MLVVAALVTPSCMGKQFLPSWQCIALALLLLVAFLLSGFHDEKFEPRQHVGVREKVVQPGFGRRVWRRVAILCAVLSKTKAKEKRVLFFMLQIMRFLPVGVDVFHTSVLAKTEL